MERTRCEKDRVHRWRRLTLMLALLFFAVTWIALDNMFLFSAKETMCTVEVPNFCGLLLSEIEFGDWLEPHVEYRYDDGVPSGSVISQLPLAGSFCKLSEEASVCDMTLVVSLGRESVILPDVVGQDVRDAALHLRQNGLTVRTQMQAGSYAVGEVISMEPRAGTQLPSGAEVTLIACTGEDTKTVIVPDLYGMTRSDALMQLWLCNLQVDRVEEEISPETKDTVIRQSHRPGTLVMAGTRVMIVVSSNEE